MVQGLRYSGWAMGALSNGGGSRSTAPVMTTTRFQFFPGALGSWAAMWLRIRLRSFRTNLRSNGSATALLRSSKAARRCSISTSSNGQIGQGEVPDEVMVDQRGPDRAPLERLSPAELSSG